VAAPQASLTALAVAPVVAASSARLGSAATPTSAASATDATAVDSSSFAAATTLDLAEWTWQSEDADRMARPMRICFVYLFSSCFS
jgi:hypothetical protein